MMVLNNVTFRHSTHLVQDCDFDSVITVERARWFHELLKRVPGLQVEDELCQEDWGVVVFVKRDNKTFWIGLSPYSPEPDSINEWLAHIHHGSFAWFQSLTASGKQAMKQLVRDIHTAMANDPLISHIVWYQEKDMNKASPKGYAEPA